MSVHPSAGDLDVTLGITESRVLVGVGGELDLLTAPDLTAILEAIVERGHKTIVVDLGRLTFIDGSGIQVFAGASFRLQPVGGVLRLRSVPPGTRHALDITGVSDLVEYEYSDISGPAVDVPARLGPEQRAGDESGLVSPSHLHTWRDPARLEAIPANDDVVDATLRLVVALARATVGGADGVSVSLSRHGVIETVASSNETIAQMDADQYATGQGPCLAAAAEGRWFHVGRLAQETRWPDFVPRAIEGGIASILSTPLLVAARPVGALNMYSNVERAFGPAEQELAALFATQASGILTQAGVDVAAGEAGHRLEDALRSREVIAQAQGVTMERSGVSADDAYATMRRSARQAGVPMRQMAADLVASSFREVTPSP